MLTGIVLTKNSSSNLSTCLKSLQFCNKVFVIDDNSTDDTAKIAKNFNVKFITHSLSDDFSAQRNFALSLVDHGWVLFIDSDEVVTLQLQKEILFSIAENLVSGYFLKRHDYLWSKHLKYGDLSGLKLLRLAQKGSGVWEGRVHETWNISGRTKILSQPLLHYPHPHLYDFITSLNTYSTIRAEELFSRRIHTNVFQITLYPLVKFLHLYLFKLGFLDGTAGFVHAGLMSFNSFLVRSKLFMLKKNISA